MRSLPIRIVHAANRWRFAIAAALIVWFLALVIQEARAKFFWHDEVYTILTSRLSVANLWRAYLDGIDLAPPLNTLITHVITPVVGVGPIVTRLPALLGFTAAVILIFETVRRKTNAVAGAVALKRYRQTLD